jgi:hypothetical protein
MPKHIRNRNHHREEDCSQVREMHGLFSTEYLKCINPIKNHISMRSQSVTGWVIAILLILILALFAAHYMGYMTLPGPLANLPRKSAPAAHLQYFFF